MAMLAWNTQHKDVQCVTTGLEHQPICAHSRKATDKGRFGSVYALHPGEPGVMFEAQW